MKTLTYNMRNWRDDPWSVWERRRIQMVDQFTELDPDIILLQEVCWAVDNQNPDNSMILWLSQQMPDYTYVQNADNGMIYENPNFDNRKEREGLAILSKINAQSFKVIPLGTGGNDGNLRICLAVYFKQFHLYNCHLSTDEVGRQINIKNFNDAVGVDAAGMMNGDLNATPEDPIFKKLTAWTDIWDIKGKGEGLTFEVPICDKPTIGLQERIDYFLAGAEFLKTAQRICTTMKNQDSSGYFSSDHLGVIAEFTE
jgi:endonuclease/exonuclease/phosphatase family metal-dependent hydrolase